MKPLGNYNGITTRLIKFNYIIDTIHSWADLWAFGEAYVSVASHCSMAAIKQICVKSQEARETEEIAKKHLNDVCTFIVIGNEIRFWAKAIIIIPQPHYSQNIILCWYSFAVANLLFFCCPRCCLPHKQPPPSTVRGCLLPFGVQGCYAIE